MFRNQQKSCSFSNFHECYVMSRDSFGLKITHYRNVTFSGCFHAIIGKLITVFSIISLVISSTLVFNTVLIKIKYCTFIHIDTSNEKGRNSIYFFVFKLRLHTDTVFVLYQ